MICEYALVIISLHYERMD